MLRAWVDEELIDGVLYLVLACGHLIHVKYRPSDGEPYRTHYVCKECR